MKALVLDTDRSLASIGGAAGVKATLGFTPVPIQNGLADVRKVLGSLFTKRSVPTENDFLDGVNETVIVPNDRARELGLDTLVLDTASTLADQEFDVAVAALNARRAADGKSRVESLDQSTWGPYGDSLTALYKGLSHTDVTVVVTCHEKRAEDAGGFATYEPNVKGSSSSKMLRSFDAVLFCKVRGSGEDAEFVWQTSPDQARPSAKTRGVDLPFEVPQDFGPVLAAFAEAGVPHPKILVVGESGTGKTTSLATLAT